MRLNESDTFHSHENEAQAFICTECGEVKSNDQWNDGKNGETCDNCMTYKCPICGDYSHTNNIINGVCIECHKYSNSN